jgi:hypothetical protein
VLSDRDEWVYRDYENVTHAFVAGRTAETDLIEELRSELAAAREGHDKAVQQRDIAIIDGNAKRDLLIEEISRRASWRWWFKLPFRRWRRALKGESPGG